MKRIKIINDSKALVSKNISPSELIRLISVILLSVLMNPCFADMMNLNEYMPTRLQDATPIPGQSMDLQFTTNFNKDRSQDQMIFRPDIRYGVSDKLQLETQSTLLSGNDEKDHGETQLGALYQFNESDNLMPVFAWNPMIIFPTGKGNRGLDFSNTFVLTSTLNGTAKDPLTQIHLNVNWRRNNTHGSDERKDAGLYIFGISQLLTKNAALIADVLHEEDSKKGEEANSFELGLHLGIGNEYYMSIGGGVGFGGQSPPWNALVALEKQIDHVFQ
jgi:hypothetical protein